MCGKYKVCMVQVHTQAYTKFSVKSQIDMSVSFENVLLLKTVNATPLQNCYNNNLNRGETEAYVDIYFISRLSEINFKR